MPAANGVDATCRDKLEVYRAYRDERLAAFDLEQAKLAAAIDEYDVRIGRLKQRLRELDGVIDGTVRSGKSVPDNLWDQRSALGMEIAAVGRESLPLYDRQIAIAQESLDVQLSPWSKAVLDFDLGILAECPSE